MSVAHSDKYYSSSDSFYPVDPGYTPHVGLYEGELELTEEYLKFWGKFLFKRAVALELCCYSVPVTKQ